MQGRAVPLPGRRPAPVARGCTIGSAPAGRHSRVRAGGAARSGPLGRMPDAGASNLCAVGIEGLRPYRESTAMTNADMEVHP